MHYLLYSEACTEILELLNADEAGAGGVAAAEQLLQPQAGGRHPGVQCGALLDHQHHCGPS